MKIIFFAIPLILIFFLANDVIAFSQDDDLECPENKIVVVRTTNPNPICVFETTAQRWVEMGIAEFFEPPIKEKLVEDLPEEQPEEITPEENHINTIPDESIDTFPELLGSFSESISAFHYDNIPDDLSRAQSYLVTFSGGELAESFTIQTFSKVDPGDGPEIVTSFQQLGFESYFVLSSNPSKDKTEFYNLIAQTINPGKDPELFDVTVDVLAGDNSVILAVNYADCKITDYLPFSQDFLLFYQFSKTIGKEIRDKATIYCNGMNLDVFNEENSKIIGEELLPYTPTSDDRLKGYVAHFSGPDFDGLYTIETISDFSPSIIFVESPYDIITIPGNPLDSEPMFFFESLPSDDKLELYEYFAMYVNPGQPPKPVDVSVDLITGDGTVLQRWNYVDCTFSDYNVFLEDSFLRFTYKGNFGPEIRDRSEFTCAGNNLDIPRDEPLPKFPFTSVRTTEQKIDALPTIPKIESRADAFRISAYDGELRQTHTSEDLQKFESIRKDRGPLTPLNHAKQFDFGFVIESLPEKNKAPFYEFVSRYIEPGKDPEPFDVSLDLLTGDKSVIYSREYTNCGAIDFWWYLQQGAWKYQFSEDESGEIRERYIFYCEGFHVNFPE